MSDDPHRLFLIEGGDLLAVAKSLQDETYVTSRVLGRFAKRHGSKSYYTSDSILSDGPVRLACIGWVHPIPPGWRVVGSRSERRLVPRKDAKQLRKEIDALPTMPNRRAVISEAIGWEANLTVEKDGRTFQEAIPKAQLLWAEDRFCIVVPLGGLFGCGSDATIRNAMAFPIPSGCREITEAQWALIAAEVRVAREQVAEPTP